MEKNNQRSLLIKNHSSMFVVFVEKICAASSLLAQTLHPALGSKTKSIHDLCVRKQNLQKKNGMCNIKISFGH